MATIAIQCLSPGDLAEKAAQSKYPPFESAQSSADMGNIGAVSKSLKGNSKPCVMTPANQRICEKLYPPRIETRGVHKFDADGTPILPPPVAEFGMDYDNAIALCLFVRAKRGKGAGPLGDTTDIFIDTAMYVCGISKRRKYATQVDRFLETVRQGKVHSLAVDGFAACAFAAVNKSDTDPSKKSTYWSKNGPSTICRVLHHCVLPVGYCGTTTPRKLLRCGQ